MAGKADTEIHDRDTVTILTPDTLVFPSFSSGGVEVGGGGGSSLSPVFTHLVRLVCDTGVQQKF